MNFRGPEFGSEHTILPTSQERGSRRWSRLAKGVAIAIVCLAGATTSASLAPVVYFAAQESAYASQPLVAIVGMVGAVAAFAMAHYIEKRHPGILG